MGRITFLILIVMWAILIIAVIKIVFLQEEVEDLKDLLIRHIDNKPTPKVIFKPF